MCPGTPYLRFLALPETPTALREALSPQQHVCLSNKKTALTRIAAGGPAHVPVGRYAQAALTNLVLKSKDDLRLASRDKLRSAFSFVERGKVAAGIAYATDAAALTALTATTATTATRAEAKAKAKAKARLIAIISAVTQPVWRAAGFIAANDGERGAIISYRVFRSSVWTFPLLSDRPLQANDALIQRCVAAAG